MKKINKNAYSILVALLLVSFIIVLTVGIFRLVLNDMYNNRIEGDYIKAYAGAESAQELALLEIKKIGYGYDGTIKNDKNPKSVMISENFLDYSKYNDNKDVLLSYYNNGKVQSYSGLLDSLGYDIIPLFFIDDAGEKGVTNISLKVTSGTSSSLSWNIIGDESGMSGVGDGNDLSGTKKTLVESTFAYETVSVSDFLSSSNTNYLVLFNSGKNKIDYTLEVNGSSTEFFTTPKLEIFSTGEVGRYRQNLKTTVDNTEFLSILKYSIYSE